MTRMTNNIDIAILTFVIVALCAWRALSNLATYWFPIDFIGILGFGFTLWAVISLKRDIKKLSNLFQLFQRLPKQLTDLKKMASKLEKYSRVTKEDQRPLKKIAETISAICNNIEKKIKGQDEIIFLRLQKVIQTCEVLSKHNICNDDVDRLHGVLTRLIYSIDEKMKDSPVIV